VIDARAREAIESSDTDELLRIVDGHCAARDWDALVDLRFRCREAVSRGKQLWGVEEHIRYRLALQAPAEWAGPIISEGSARFALGPLPEVAASTKTWAEMEPHLEAGPERMTFAAERLIHGDQVDEATPLPPLQRWEPEYFTATYKADKVETPGPKIDEPLPVELSDNPERADDVESEHALADLVEPWIDQSNGRCQTATVAGTALEAVAALGPPNAATAELEPGQALALMAWTAASGGAHGRRRGAAAGRYLAWWVVATLADIVWPPDDHDAIGEAVERLRWHWFDDGSPPGGWALRLAVEDPSLGMAWAISANDVAD
jgi:hypothetical protein